jgi:hypothetical protein
MIWNLREDRRRATVCRSGAGFLRLARLSRRLRQCLRAFWDRWLSAPSAFCLCCLRTICRGCELSACPALFIPTTGRCRHFAVPADRPNHRRIRSAFPSDIEDPAVGLAGFSHTVHTFQDIQPRRIVNYPRTIVEDRVRMKAENAPTPNSVAAMSEASEKDGAECRCFQASATKASPKHAAAKKMALCA